MENVKLYLGDCVEVMREMEAASVDAVVCDPPYGLAFMGKTWDVVTQAWHQAWAEAALRVAKPGAHLLAFGGTRTFHRLACAIEDAGWVIRDCVMWVYGSGFPKSLDISKAIDKEAGAERERVRGVRSGVVGGTYAQDKWSCEFKDSVLDSVAITPAAREWQGYGTALKPAWEPVIVAMKPCDGTFAQNAVKHGVAGVNVEGCRVGSEAIKTQGGDKFPGVYGTYATCAESTHQGRFPANVIHDGSEEATAGMGDASRYYYTAKASRAERNEGCAGMPEGAPPASARSNPAPGRTAALGARRENHHPTVKPIALMRYLVRLVSMPKGSTILDPFMGSGSTGIACALERQRFIGIEREAEYFEIAKARIAHHTRQGVLL